MKKKIIAFMVSVTVALGQTGSTRAKAKKKRNIYIFPEKITVRIGESKKIKINMPNAKNKRKVKWKTSNGKVKLKKTNKKYAVVCGIKKGNAKVYAYVGKKKMTCSVTVKKKKVSAGNRKEKNYGIHMMYSNTVIYSDCNDSLLDFPVSGADYTPSLIEEPEKFLRLTSSNNDAAKNGKGIVLVSDKGLRTSMTWESSDTSVIDFTKKNYTENDSFVSNGHLYWCPDYRIGNLGSCRVTVRCMGKKYTGTVTVKPSDVYSTASRIVSQETDNGMTDVQKAAHLAKWIMQNTKYRAAEENTMASVFYSHIGACKEYSKAYAYLCSFAGLKSRAMVSPCHMWTQVRINGKWYNADLSGLPYSRTLPVFLSDREYYSHLASKKTFRAYTVSRDNRRTPYDMPNGMDTGDEYDSAGIGSLL